MNEVVKYHNDLNTVIMRRWSSEEMNFFFAIIAKSREKGGRSLLFHTDDLKDLTKFSDKHQQRWELTMKNVAKKIAQLTYYEETEQKFEVMTLFKKLSVDFEERSITVGVSEEFEYILNKLQAQFTVYELEEFTQIKSTYAKTMYRLLKQWRTQGKKTFTIKEFRSLLDVPVSFKASHIKDRILKPVEQQLSPYFIGFKIKTIKSRERGNPVIAYEFTWQAEQTGEWKDFDKLGKNKKKKPIRSESVPEDILAAEREDEERKKKLQEEFFQKAMKFRDLSFEIQAELFSEAREVDTYRMPNATQFLDTLATLMNFDLEKYWDQVLNNAQSEGENIG